MARVARTNLVHLFLVGALGWRHVQPNADGGRGLAHVRPDLQRLGLRHGRLVSIRARLADDAARRAHGRPLPPGPHLCDVHGGASGRGAGAAGGDANRPRHARADFGLVGGAGLGARVSDARPAGADAAAGAARAAATRHRHQFQRDASGGDRRPGSGRRALHLGGRDGLHRLRRAAGAGLWAGAAGALPLRTGPPVGDLGRLPG